MDTEIECKIDDADMFLWAAAPALFETLQCNGECAHAQKAMLLCVHIYKTMPDVFLHHILPKIPSRVQRALHMTCRTTRDWVRLNVTSLAITPSHPIPTTNLGTAFPRVTQLSVTVHGEPNSSIELSLFLASLSSLLPQLYTLCLALPITRDRQRLIIPAATSPLLSACTSLRRLHLLPTDSSTFKAFVKINAPQATLQHLRCLFSSRSPDIYVTDVIDHCAQHGGVTTLFLNTTSIFKDATIDKVNLYLADVASKSSQLRHLYLSVRHCAELLPLLSDLKDHARLRSLGLYIQRVEDGPPNQHPAAFEALMLITQLTSLKLIGDADYDCLEALVGLKHLKLASASSSSSVLVPRFTDCAWLDSLTNLQDLHMSKISTSAWKLPKVAAARKLTSMRLSIMSLDAWSVDRRLPSVTHLDIELQQGQFANSFWLRKTSYLKSLKLGKVYAADGVFEALPALTQLTQLTLDVAGWQVMTSPLNFPRLQALKVSSSVKTDGDLDCVQAFFLALTAPLLVELTGKIECGITAWSLLQLAARSPSLDLSRMFSGDPSSCTQVIVDDMHLPRIAEVLPQLLHLPDGYLDWRSVTDAGLRDAAVVAASSLVQLSISSLSPADLSNMSLMTLAEQCPNLTMLQVAAALGQPAAGFTATGVGYISTGLTQLVCLKLQGCRWLTDDCFRHLVGRCLRLKELCLDGMGFVKPASYVALKNLPCLTTVAFVDAFLLTASVANLLIRSGMSLSLLNS